MKSDGMSRQFPFLFFFFHLKQSNFAITILPQICFSFSILKSLPILGKFINISNMNYWNTLVDSCYQLTSNSHTFKILKNRNKNKKNKILNVIPLNERAIEQSEHTFKICTESIWPISTSSKSVPTSISRIIICIYTSLLATKAFIYFYFIQSS